MGVRCEIEMWMWREGKGKGKGGGVHVPKKQKEGRESHAMRSMANNVAYICLGAGRLVSDYLPLANGV